LSGKRGIDYLNYSGTENLRSNLQRLCLIGNGQKALPAQNAKPSAIILLSVEHYINLIDATNALSTSQDD
jgi:hypothetical protein